MSSALTSDHDALLTSIASATNPSEVVQALDYVWRIAWTSKDDIVLQERQNTLAQFKSVATDFLNFVDSRPTKICRFSRNPFSKIGTDVSQIIFSFVGSFFSLRNLSNTSKFCQSVVSNEKFDLFRFIELNFNSNLSEFNVDNSERAQLVYDFKQSQRFKDSHCIFHLDITVGHIERGYTGFSLFPQSMCFRRHR